VSSVGSALIVGIGSPVCAAGGCGCVGAAGAGG
jgi:hypothetical protein